VDAKQVFVGKRKGEPASDRTRSTVSARGGAGRTESSSRLKGRRSFHLRSRRRGARILCSRPASPVTVVPGITAALGCAAEAGLPLTFRKEATRLTFVTANVAEARRRVGLDFARRSAIDARGLQWALSSAAAVQKGLLDAGRDRATTRRGIGARHAARIANIGDTGG
jgi:uroporphyrin-III C-methyltransferase/precorrin-2 dehydrogenase/sirohydrochlorin ferrochelatase